ncbi:hypothetical protein J6590_059080 [Homalodisca vitripennis]|nr:hypothetical protein J6590_059080 [Homalodisca vitripennis]
MGFAYRRLTESRKAGELRDRMKRTVTQMFCVLTDLSQQTVAVVTTCSVLSEIGQGRAQQGEMPTSVKDEVGDVEASLDLDGLPEQVQEYARETLGETEDNKIRTLQEFSDIIYGVSGNLLVWIARSREHETAEPLRQFHCWGQDGSVNGSRVN